MAGIKNPNPQHKEPFQHKRVLQKKMVLNRTTITTSKEPLQKTVPKKVLRSL